MKWLIITCLFSSAAMAEETYPREIRVAFLDKCVGLNKELVQPCKCIINGLQTHIAFEEFEKQVLSMPNPMLEPRVKAISQQCAFKSSGKQ